VASGGGVRKGLSNISQYGNFHKKIVKNISNSAKVLTKKRSGETPGSHVVQAKKSSIGVSGGNWANSPGARSTFYEGEDLSKKKGFAGYLAENSQAGLYPSLSQGVMVRRRSVNSMSPNNNNTEGILFQVLNINQVRVCIPALSMGITLTARQCMRPRGLAGQATSRSSLAVGKCRK
jgi:hypothetical protein